MKIQYTLTELLWLCGMVLTLSLTSCSDDGDEGGGVRPGTEVQSEVIDNNTSQWTYYSLENNKVIGTSVFGDSVSDRSWSERTDWDIAFCGTLIRTNGGDSGKGQGGIQISDKQYATVEEAPSFGYVTDKYE